MFRGWKCEEGSPAWIARDLVDEARRISPRRFLEARFATVRVERDGASLTVPRILRSDLKGGRWVTCDWAGQGIGDNIALVRSQLGCGFVEAVGHLLSGGIPTTPPPSAVPTPGTGQKHLPKLPSVSDPARGRAYLEARGIAAAIVTAAEADGALVHIRDGIAFVGRDEDGVVRATSVRTIHGNPGEGQASKRDLRGTDKRYPVILPGDQARIVVVEGGVTGLAVQTLALLQGRSPPMVIVTGGIGVYRWAVEKSRLAAHVAAASAVIVAAENELDERGSPDPVRQAITDRRRDVLMTALGKLRPDGLRLVRPPSAYGDAADWLMARLTVGPSAGPK